MKIATLFLTLMTAGATALLAEDIDSMPPVVVKTTPQAGAKNVHPGVTEIKVTFSKKMTNGSWSWSTAWENSDPEVIGKPKYSTDYKTCILKVKLEPNKTYGYWINSQKFQNFKDQQGHPAVPYLLAFHTSDTPAATSEEHGDKTSAATSAAEAWLKMVDDGNYPQSWTETGAIFQGVVTKDSWDESLKAVRKPLGKVNSREVSTTHYSTTLPGAPDGEYVVLQFNSSFEDKNSAVETVSMTLQKDGKWRTDGYFIK
jgi:hypothetical protein